MKFRDVSTHYVWHHLIIIISVHWRKELNAVDSRSVGFPKNHVPVRWEDRTYTNFDAVTEPRHNPGYAVCMSHLLQNTVLVKFHRTGDKTTTSVHNCWRVSGHHTLEVHPVSFMRVNQLGKSDFSPTTFCRPNLFTCVLRIHTHGVVLAKSSPKSWMLTSRHKHHGQNGVRIPMNEAHARCLQTS